MKRIKSPAKATETGQFRIIGGQWRGRKLQFPAVKGLRPTPDRVRETVFNWLAPHLQAMQCLDLYSGCGALGLEALSRGAAYCTFVDNSRPALQAIEQHLDVLKGQGKTLVAELPQAIALLNQPVDIVFIDPPYADQSIETCVQLLLEKQLVKPEAWLYCENGSDKSLPQLPSEFVLHRHKTAGAVQYALYYYRRVS